MSAQERNCEAFRPLTPQEQHANETIATMENALRFRIWNTLALGSEGYDMTEEFDAVGQEIAEVTQIQGLGKEQLAPLAQLGRKDENVKFFYHAMASSDKGAPLSKRREFVGVNRALITLLSRPGSYEQNQQSVEGMVGVYMQSIRPQTLDGLKSFWNTVHADPETVLLLLPLTPLGSASLRE